jgi:hypothetical protein
VTKITRVNDNYQEWSKNENFNQYVFVVFSNRNPSPILFFMGCDTKEFFSLWNIYIYHVDNFGKLKKIA